MPNNGALNNTITSPTGSYTIPAGYTSGGTVSVSLPSTSVSTPDSTKNASNVVTRANATWESGFIDSGSIDAATFASEGTSGVTYLDLSDGVDGSSNNIIPEIPTGGYLYINKGYVDNFKISLSRLIPDASAVNNLAGNYILSGHSAYDNAGNLVVGTISSKAAATYYPSAND